MMVTPLIQAALRVIITIIDSDEQSKEILALNRGRIDAGKQADNKIRNIDPLTWLLFGLLLSLSLTHKQTFELSEKYRPTSEKNTRLEPMGLAIGMEGISRIDAISPWSCYVI